MPAIRQRTVALPRGESQPGAELVGGTGQAGERSPIAEAPPKCARRGFSSGTSHREVCGSGVLVPEIRFSSSSTAGSGDTRRGGFMQRFLTFVVLLLLTVPVGLSLQGCANKNADFCNGVGFSYNTTQPVSISLQPQTTGLSVAFSQTSQLQAPSSLNCKGGAASVSTLYLRDL